VRGGSEVGAKRLQEPRYTGLSSRDGVGRRWAGGVVGRESLKRGEILRTGWRVDGRGCRKEETLHLQSEHDATMPSSNMSGDTTKDTWLPQASNPLQAQASKQASKRAEYLNKVAKQASREFKLPGIGTGNGYSQIARSVVPRYVLLAQSAVCGRELVRWCLVQVGKS
jgi:hypothetical protein